MVQLPDPTDEQSPLRALVRDAELAEREGRRADARELYEHALAALTTPADASMASSVLRWVGRTYWIDADYEAALDCVQAALTVAHLAGDEAAAGHAVNLHANVCVQQGRLDEAELLYEQARATAVHAGDFNLAAMTAQNLGVIANIHGDRKRALAHYENSLAHYRSLGLAKDVCVALNNLGKLHTELCQWPAAERAYDEAVQISMQLGDLSTRIVLDVNLAQFWIAQAEYGSARRACDHAAELAERLGDSHALAETECSYGVIERETGDQTTAETHFARAEAIAGDRQDKLLLAEIARERAELYRQQGRNRDMLQCLNRAHRMFAELRAEHAVADVDRRTRGLEGDFLDVVRRWGDSIESKDHHTQGHSMRVADMSCRLAAASGMDEGTLFWFRIGALLHDVGKIMVPEEVLNKPGKLSADEWELIKRHPVAGVEMLADIDFPWDVLPMVESHHERWDGRGYPHGKAGEEIPRPARILCIADVYDALTSQRSYKRALTHDEALDVMTREGDEQFDPALFALFVQMMREAPPLPRARVATPIGLASAPSIAYDEPALPPHHVDDITGLPLRAAFLERAAMGVAASAAVGAEPAALLVIDVDRFTALNASYGRRQGDDVLHAVASMLVALARPGDIVARYARDEFVALLPNTPIETARVIADQLREQARELRVARRDGAPDPVRFTLSIGCAIAPSHGLTVPALYAAAESALFAARESGADGTVTAVVPA